ncbi:MAG: hypothetical protein J5I54_08655 [Bacteroidales bacterium]|nr:hypothetical protein [Bacteroidales bacterium]
MTKEGICFRGHLGEGTCDPREAEPRDEQTKYESQLFDSQIIKTLCGYKDKNTTLL